MINSVEKLKLTFRWLRIWSKILNQITTWKVCFQMSRKNVLICWTICCGMSINSFPSFILTWRYNPIRRLTATQALAHAYFKEEIVRNPTSNTNTNSNVTNNSNNSNSNAKIEERPERKLENTDEKKSWRRLAFSKMILPCRSYKLIAIKWNLGADS